MTAAPPARLGCVLVDLDGTLVDSAPGITRCLAETIRAFGGPALRPSELRASVGPPVADTIRTLTGLPAERLPDAIAHYRSLYLERGIDDSAVFPGIHALLAMLREWGVPVAVATSKRESHARALLAHHGLERLFATVSGAAEDDSGADKRGVIEAALARIDRPAAEAIMIGDRSYDVRGARAAGASAMFAAWGYGGARESAGAVLLARDPREASRLLHAQLAHTSATRQGVAS